ncbi:MAG: class I SAM-dependent methyltransferase, partial [Dehalococcoidia bacterium]
VLELGCGTGRVTLPMAEAGFEVVGLDLSAGMLAEAERKLADMDEDVRRRVQFIQGDMADFDLGRLFALVVIPFRAFQLLLTTDDERRCLDCVRRHLRPGGRLVIAIFDPLLSALAPGTTSPDDDGWEGVHPVTSNRVTVGVVSRTNHTVEQLLEESWRFREFAPSGALLREEEERLRMRWIYRYEMRYLLELSGFEIEAEYSDFRGSPPAYAGEQVWVVRRPGD